MKGEKKEHMAKKDVFVTKNQEHIHTGEVPDKEIPGAKVMITVEFTSKEMNKSRLRWKVPVLAPIQRILEKVGGKFSVKTNLLRFTILGKEVNPGDLAGQYGGKVIKAMERSGEMTMDLDVEESEDV